MAMKSSFWCQNSKKLVAEQECGFRVKPAKLIPRITSVLPQKKQQAMDDRRFGKRFRRKNNDNRAVNVGRLGAKQDWKHFGRSWVSEKSAKNIQATFDSCFRSKTANCFDNSQYSPIVFHNQGTFFLASFHVGIWPLTIRNVWRMGPFQ